MSIVFCVIMVIMENETNQNKTFWQSAWELARFAIIALIIVVPIRMFVVEPFVVSGASMFPTFDNGDYLIVDKISYELGNPQRNDVVIFKYPNDQTKFFIKRIIGLPNETVNIKNGVVTIVNSTNPDGFVLDEPYIKNVSSTSTNLELKDDEYFVMGDNRNASSDSRYWGAVKKDLLTGKALVRLMPITSIDLLPGQYRQAQ
jgi:signal peptidase I